MSERRALVVDDDAGIRALVSRVLTRHGFRVDAVRDGAEAIEHVLQHEYAVITLDLMMPRIDGFTVVRYLTENRPATLEKVIVMTAYGSAAKEKVCPPVARFIEKPFDINRLLAVAAECGGAADTHVAAGNVDTAAPACTAPRLPLREVSEAPALAANAPTLVESAAAE